MADLKILYFAWVRERIGRDEDVVSRPDGGATIATLLADLSASSPGHAAAFAEPERLRAALDQQFVPLDHLVGDARELAIFPPVTGG